MNFTRTILSFLLLAITVVHSINLSVVRLHFELNRDFIAKNLCINRFNPESDCAGKCVLMQKLSAEAEKEAQSKAVFTPGMSFSFFYQDMPRFNYPANVIQIEKYKYRIRNEKLTSAPFINSDFPPPELIA